jgi:hypothetical protein
MAWGQLCTQNEGASHPKQSSRPDRDLLLEPVREDILDDCVV